jgi:hypothetical protein
MRPRPTAHRPLGAATFPPKTVPIIGCSARNDKLKGSWRHRARIGDMASFCVLEGIIHRYWRWSAPGARIPADMARQRRGTHDRLAQSDGSF